MNLASTFAYNTFGVDHRCQSIHVVRDVAQLEEALETLDHPVILGGGSNVLFTQDLDRPVIVIALDHIDIIGESASHVLIRVGAGTNWHRLVIWTVSRDYGGLENLSLIPGCCGAAPMQNIGAYGVELQDVFVDLHAVSVSDRHKRLFSMADCQFGYRQSVFKHDLKEAYVITEMTLRLTKRGHHQYRLSYGAIQDELDKRGTKVPDVASVSQVIMDIRRSKLPDPAELPNAGSFFKNPVIPMGKYEKLKTRYRTLPAYPVDSDTIKIPAAWLIEQSGWKGRREGYVGTHVHQALVIVNHGTRNGMDILKFSQKIQEAVMDGFQIALEREVNVY